MKLLEQFLPKNINQFHNFMPNFPKIFECFFLLKKYLNIEKIKVTISQNFLTLISTLKEEDIIVPTKMAQG